MIYIGQLSPAQKERYLQQRPGEVGALNLEAEKWDGLFGATSPDGFSWKPIPDPLVAQISDTLNVCEYDPVLGQYVAYCRSHFFNRRSIGRTASADFRRLPLSEEVFWPNAAAEPYDLWYANSKTKMPGTTDYHLMFPLRWRLIDDSFSFVLAASPDNVVWNFVPGGPVCEPGDGGHMGRGGGVSRHRPSALARRAHGHHHLRLARATQASAPAAARAHCLGLVAQGTARCSWKHR